MNEFNQNIENLQEVLERYNKEDKISLNAILFLFPILLFIIYGNSIIGIFISTFYLFCLFGFLSNKDSKRYSYNKDKYEKIYILLKSKNVEDLIVLNYMFKKILLKTNKLSNSFILKFCRLNTVDIKKYFDKNKNDMSLLINKLNEYNLDITNFENYYEIKLIDKKENLFELLLEVKDLSKDNNVNLLNEIKILLNKLKNLDKEFLVNENLINYDVVNNNLKEILKILKETKNEELNNVFLEQANGIMFGSKKLIDLILLEEKSKKLKKLEILNNLTNKKVLLISK